jgi:O-antigen biosynthesis protein WbqV
MVRKFVLEMGEPVRIVDLARQMIELSGAKVGESIDIKIVGLRPGEKLTEQLVDENERAINCAEGISEICEQVARPGLGETFVERIRRRAESGDDWATRQSLWAAVESIRSATVLPYDQPRNATAAP